MTVAKEEKINMKINFVAKPSLPPSVIVPSNLDFALQFIKKVFTYTQLPTQFYNFFLSFKGMTRIVHVSLIGF